MSSLAKMEQNTPCGFASMKTADIDKTDSPYKLGDVVGSSMEPTLRRGDTVLVDTSMERPRRGDIVALKSYVHRFLWRDPFGGIWHSGDQFKNIARASPDSFQGVVKSVIRDGNFVDVPKEEISNYDCFRSVLRGVCYETWRRARGLHRKLSSL